MATLKVVAFAALLQLAVGFLPIDIPNPGECKARGFKVTIIDNSILCFSSRGLQRFL